MMFVVHKSSSTDKNAEIVALDVVIGVLTPVSPLVCVSFLMT